MTRRMRLSRFSAVALWAFALCASSTPARVPDPQPALLAGTVTRDLSIDSSTQVGDHGIDDSRLLPQVLIDLHALEDVQTGVRRAGNGTRVAEPSTLLLVSFGLFGLIAWSRRRR